MYEEIIAKEIVRLRRVPNINFLYSIILQKDPKISLSMVINTITLLEELEYVEIKDGEIIPTKKLVEALESRKFMESLESEKRKRRLEEVFTKGRIIDLVILGSVDLGEFSVDKLVRWVERRTLRIVNPSTVRNYANQLMRVGFLKPSDEGYKCTRLLKEITLNQGVDEVKKILKRRLPESLSALSIRKLHKR